MPSVIVERQALVAALKICANAVERRIVVPVLGSVRLVAAAGKLTLSTTNCDQWISTTIGCDLAADDFADCVAADALLRLASAIPEGAQITLTPIGERTVTGSGRLEVKSGRSRYNLATWPAVDFPSHSEPPPDTISLPLPGKDLARALDGTVYACEPEGSARYNLQGCCVDLSGKDIEIVATNGHVLARHRLPAPDKVKRLAQPIVPIAAAKIIARLAEAQEEIRLELSDKHCAIDDGTTRFYSKLIDAQFPDYRRAMPGASDRRIVVDQAELIGAVTRLLIVESREKDARGEIEADCLEGGTLLLRRSSEVIGDAQEELAAEVAGKPLEPFAFNPRYLLELVGHFAGARLVIDQGDPGMPIRLESDEASHDAVLMPVRRLKH